MMVCYFEITGICRSEKYLEEYIFTKQRFEKKSRYALLCKCASHDLELLNLFYET